MNEAWCKLILGRLILRTLLDQINKHEFWKLPKTLIGLWLGHISPIHFHVIFFISWVPQNSTWIISNAKDGSFSTTTTKYDTLLITITTENSNIVFFLVPTSDGNNRTCIICKRRSTLVQIDAFPRRISWVRKDIKPMFVLINVIYRWIVKIYRNKSISRIWKNTWKVSNKNICPIPYGSLFTKR